MMLEILSIALVFVIGYFFGLNAGYRMPRIDEEEETNGVVNVEVLQDVEQDTYLAYDLLTKKFLGQAKEIGELVDMLKNKFPHNTIVLSRTQEL